ncbi:MAG: 50S ribosomal protein L11 methyltransferase [Vulcanimicrobiota bacterium]
MQKWLEVQMCTTPDFLPHLISLLVSQKIKSWVEEEGENQVKITIYIPYFEGVEKYLAPFKSLMDVKKIQVVAREIEDENWAESWKKFFTILHIGERFVLKPPWAEYQPEENEIVIEIEPRMAFGTGYHPTTVGTLRLMEKHIKPGMKVLDMGCGSGILSLAAAELGASEVIGMDYDEICIRESAENYRLAQKKNPALTSGCQFVLSDGFEKVTEKYDAVLVNIFTSFILHYQQAISDSLKPGGLFVSGSIGSGKMEDVILGFDMVNMILLEKIEENGWEGAVFQRLA